MTYIIVSIILASILGAFSAKFLLRGNHISLGFAGGAILGLVFLDIIPEVFEEAALLEVNTLVISGGLLMGFVVMHVLEKVSGFHEHDHGNHTPHTHSTGSVTIWTLSLHALIDGVGIGAAYLVSQSLGTAILFAFILHKFLDGMNIQAIAQASTAKNRKLFLMVNIIATIVGVLLVSNMNLSSTTLLCATALVGGVLLYVSSSHVLPEAHAHENSWRTIGATLVGVLSVYILSLI